MRSAVILGSQNIVYFALTQPLCQDFVAHVCLGDFMQYLPPRVVGVVPR